MVRDPGHDLSEAVLDLAGRVGDQLRRRRGALGLTLAETARRAGVSISHLSAIETGSSVPSLPILARIVDALDLSLNEVLRSVGGGADVSTGSLAVEARGTKTLSQSTLQLQVVSLVAGPHEEGPSPVHPAGAEVFVYVHRGEIELLVDGEPYVLREGDSLDAEGVESIVYGANERSVTIWVSAPSPGTPG